MTTEAVSGDLPEILKGAGGVFVALYALIKFFGPWLNRTLTAQSARAEKADLDVERRLERAEQETAELRARELEHVAEIARLRARVELADVAFESQSRDLEEARAEIAGLRAQLAREA